MLGEVVGSVERGQCVFGSGEGALEEGAEASAGLPVVWAGVGPGGG